MSKEKLEFVEPVDTNTDNEMLERACAVRGKEVLFFSHHCLDWIRFSCY